MFGFFKDNKPEILKHINLAILEENKRLKYGVDKLIEKLNDGINEFELSQYIFNLKMDSPLDRPYEKKSLFVENASSREMFQALNNISSDAKYNVDKDYASGTVKGYNIFLMRHKGFGQTQVGISATYNKIDELYQNVIDSYSANKDSREIPSFINNLME